MSWCLENIHFKHDEKYFFLMKAVKNNNDKNILYAPGI